MEIFEGSPRDKFYEIVFGASTQSVANTLDKLFEKIEFFDKPIYRFPDQSNVPFLMNHLKFQLKIQDPNNPEWLL